MSSFNFPILSVVIPARLKSLEWNNPLVSKLLPFDQLIVSFTIVFLIPCCNWYVSSGS